jgi:hypothetical protein
MKLLVLKPLIQFFVRLNSYLNSLCMFLLINDFLKYRTRGVSITAKG